MVPPASNRAGPPLPHPNADETIRPREKDPRNSCIASRSSTSDRVEPLQSDAKRDPSPNMLAFERIVITKRRGRGGQMARDRALESLAQSYHRESRRRTAEDRPSCARRPLCSGRRRAGRALFWSTPTRASLRRARHTARLDVEDVLLAVKPREGPCTTAGEILICDYTPQALDAMRDNVSPREFNPCIQALSKSSRTPRRRTVPHDT